jgi:hypothetical protein
MPDIRNKEAVDPKLSRYCSKCGFLLPLSRFGKRSGRPDGLSVQCKRCRNESSKNSRQRLIAKDPKRREIERKRCKQHYNTKKGKDNARQRHLKNSYGITTDEYNLLFNKQSGKCAICDRHQSELKQSLCVDHNHKTGKVRGLLCDSCNKGIGCFQDNVDLLSNRIQYIKAE